MMMLKRKFGDRSDWKRNDKRKYSQAFLNTKNFKGHITLLHTLSVTSPLCVSYGRKKLCIVDDGYMWLQQFPLRKNHTVTTMFDSKGNIIQWYIDICLHYGIDNTIPWIDDLFLDIVILPTGELYVLDDDELEDALKNNIINQSLYDLAWKEVKIIKSLARAGNFNLLKLSNAHKNFLSKILK